MSASAITPYFIFGLNSEIKGNVYFSKDSEVLYPVGAVIALHDFQTNRQKYLKLPDKRRPINIICLSSNKKLLAVAEKGDPPSVSIYDLASLRRINVWNVSRSDSPSAVEFASIAFSRDNKLLAGITGHPDWLLLCYSTERNRVESSGKAQNPVNPGPILQVSFSPEDSSMVCIGGPGCLRFLQYTETVWNQEGFSKSEYLQITTFCWLSQYKVLAGTRDGRLIVFEDGDLRATHIAKDLPYLNLRDRVQAPDDSESRSASSLEEAIKAAYEPFGSRPGRMELNSLISFGKGFAFSYGFGFVYVYWRESDTRFRRSHIFKVVSLSWSRSDYQLVSCGIQGNVYEWDLPLKKRTAETVSSTKPFTCAVISPGATSTFASGLDGRICELAQSKVMQTFTFADRKLNMVMLSHSDKMIFVTDSDGTLITLSLPLTPSNEWTSLDMHNQLIVKMKISFDDRWIITASEDGSICIWKVDTSKVTGMIKLSADIIESKDVLIGKEDLQNKVELIQELTARVSHLELEHAFKMKQAKDQHAEKLQEIQDSYYGELEDLKNVNEDMESKHAQEISLLNENVEKLKLSFETKVNNLESEYNDKLITEYDKYEKLEELHKLLKEECETKYNELLKDKEMALQNMTDDYEEKLNQKILEIAELHKQALCRAKEHEEIKSQIEDDVDREMVELKTKYERLLKEERDNSMHLRGEMAAMKKRLISSQKEIDELVNQVQTLQGEQHKYKQAIHGLEKDITDLKKEIQERDTSVHLKETRIFELKRRNQELEKFKYVLNFKITELKNQKEPREREIKERKEQIQDMERELGVLQNKNEIFELKMKYYNEKLAGMEAELKNRNIHAHTLNTYCQRMQCDIYNASGFIHNPKKLKELVKQLNMKYNKDKAIIKAKEEDEGASIEFQRQREHLERTIATLRSQLQKETERSRRNHFHLVGENSALITEMNKMQFELKAALKHIQEIETIVGLTGKSESINEAQMKFKAALTTNEEIHESYAKRIEHLEQIIEVQKEELDRMSSKLSHSEQVAAKPGRSSSTS